MINNESIDLYDDKKTKKLSLQLNEIAIIILCTCLFHSDINKNELEVTTFIKTQRMEFSFIVYIHSIFH